MVFPVELDSATQAAVLVKHLVGLGVDAAAPGRHQHAGLAQVIFKEFPFFEQILYAVDELFHQCITWHVFANSEV